MDWRQLLVRARDRLQPLLSKLGVAGIIGVSLCVFSAALFVSTVLPLKAHGADLKRDLAALQGEHNRMPVATNDNVQLAAFIKNFPSVDQVPDTILKIHSIAEQNGLRLETGEYRLTRDRELNMDRYQMLLPLHGSYAQARLFIAQAMDEVPALALEEVAIKRDSAAQRDVETRVRFTLFLVDLR